MSKDDVLKKIELKVAIQCCDGCKKKVKKAVESVKGAVGTEIHRSEQRITVWVRDVEAQVLINKLEKIGKFAEIWPGGSGSGSGSKAKDKGKDSGNESNKEQSNSCSAAGGEKDAGANKCPPQANKSASSSSSQPEISPGIVHCGGPVLPEYPHSTGPFLVTRPCYMLTASSIPPTYYVRDPHYYEMPVSYGHVQPHQHMYPEYYDDDDSVACRIM